MFKYVSLPLTMDLYDALSNIKIIYFTFKADITLKYNVELGPTSFKLQIDQSPSYEIVGSSLPSSTDIQQNIYVSSPVMTLLSNRYDAYGNETFYYFDFNTNLSTSQSHNLLFRFSHINSMVYHPIYLSSIRTGNGSVAKNIEFNLYGI